MDLKNFAGFIFLGALFGILGGAVAFLRAYDGYSHFPGIPKRKRLLMSLQYAALAFVFIIGITIILVILYNSGML
jgi:hypothetical protein